MFKKISFVLVLLFALISLPVSAAKPDGKGGKPGGGDTPATLRYVCLDPGHGGTDPGAVRGNVRESDLNLDVARAVELKLTEINIQSAMTRIDDSTKSNNDRYTFCDATPATTLVSIHHNASTDTTVDYTLGMYQQSNSKVLAESVGLSVATAVSNNDFRITRYPSGVLIKSDMPSMMSEAYFLSNTNRLNQLNDPMLRAQLIDSEAQAIVDGLVKYYNR